MSLSNVLKGFILQRTHSRAHDLLSVGNEHFQMAAHPQRVLFWCADAIGRCELVSGNWHQHTGQRPVDALGDGWLQRVSATDRKRVQEVVQWAVSAHRGFSVQYELIRADGSARRVLHDAAARILSSGRFNGFIATITDESNMAQGADTLEDTTQQIYQFLDHVQLPALAVDFNGVVVHANAALAALSGREIADLIDARWLADCVTAEDTHRAAALIDGRIAPASIPAELEFHLRAYPEPRLLRWHLTLIRDAEGNPASIAMMGNDITQWRKVGNHQRLAAQMFENSKEAMVITDRDNRIISVNPSFTRLTGYTREEAIGQNPRILQSGKHDQAFYKAMWESLSTLGYWRGDIWDRRKDGTQYPKFLAITANKDDDGEILNYSAIFYDITERKALEEELDYLAHYDALTGLPNRMLLQDRLEQSIAIAERHQQHFALLFIDLDGFKAVNDTFGHSNGDLLLQEVANRLLHCVREVDTVARLGGDEFVVLHP